MPLARVVTPNLPEAEILSGRKIGGEEDFADVARAISNGGKVSVFLKAGHLQSETLVDYLYNAEDGTMTLLPSKRFHTENTHGTGCTLSSALAAALARGFSLADAAVCAKKYISEAIRSGADVKTGNGFGPVNHGFDPQKMFLNNKKNNQNVQ